MKVACKVSGDDMVGDYSYAVIRLDRDYLLWLKSRMVKAQELEAENSAFYGLEYFDSRAMYYSTLDIDIPAEEFVAFTAGDEGDSEAQLTEAEGVAITASSVIWHATPKHGDGRFETIPMYEEILDRLLESCSSAQAGQ